MIRAFKIGGEWRVGQRAVAHWFIDGSTMSRCGKLSRHDTELAESVVRCGACWELWCQEAKPFDDGASV